LLHSLPPSWSRRIGRSSRLYRLLHLLLLLLLERLL